MELLIAEEKAYLLADQLTPEQAQEKAWGARMSALGALNKLLFRPREEDVQLVGFEKRYTPFWHLVCRAEYEYDRRARFTVTASGPEVKRVTITDQGEAHPVSDARQFTLTGVEHCYEEWLKNITLDAVTGTEQRWLHYLETSSTLIEDLATFQVEEAVIVPPEVRSSFVVRQVLSEMMKGVQADTLHKDVVEISAIDLYLRPIFAYEYRWATKDKRAVVEVDGITGEFRTDNRALGQQWGRMLTPELLFDVGIDAVDLLVPGGGIALKVGRAIARRQQQGSEQGSTPAGPRLPAPR